MVDATRRRRAVAVLAATALAVTMCATAGPAVADGIPNLRMDTVVAPTGLVGRGIPFRVSHLVWNSGDAAAGPSVTKFFLGRNRHVPVEPLPGTFDVAGIDLGGNAAGENGKTQIPQGVRNGVYYVIGCVDVTDVVAEVNEEDNCKSAPSPVTLVDSRPELVLIALSDPPAARVQGGTFEVTDTIFNAGVVPAGPTTTAYYLSTDNDRSKSDVKLAGERDIAKLGVEKSSAGSEQVRIPNDTPPGLYVLLGCVDDGEVRAELYEFNNCVPTFRQVQVKRR